MCRLRGKHGSKYTVREVDVATTLLDLLFVELCVTSPVCKANVHSTDESHMYELMLCVHNHSFQLIEKHTASAYIKYWKTEPVPLTTKALKT